MEVVLSGELPSFLQGVEADRALFLAVLEHFKFEFVRDQPLVLMKHSELLAFLGPGE